LTTVEVQALLANAEADFIPAIALACFAGLRPESEIQFLDWSAIDLKERTIDITKSKNIAGHRFVRITVNLAAWLKLCHKKRGPVSPRGNTYYSRLHRARELAVASLEEGGVPAVNLRKWPQDCMRHSFASYHFARFKNAGLSAEQLGHGGKLGVFFRCYRNRVKASDAVAYWKILPAAA
jgi:integrase